MEAAIKLRAAQGADHMDLATGEQTWCTGAYESLGFSNREGKV